MFILEVQTFPFAWHPDWHAGPDGSGLDCCVCHETITTEQLGLWMPHHGKDGEHSMRPMHRLCLFVATGRVHPALLEEQRQLEARLLERWEAGEDD